MSLVPIYSVGSVRPIQFAHRTGPVPQGDSDLLMRKVDLFDRVAVGFTHTCDDVVTETRFEYGRVFRIRHLTN
jgi:hypothetical protein